MAKVLETQSLIQAVESRAKSYEELRGKLEALKNNFSRIVNLDESFSGKGAEAIKGFYRGQMDVVDAWIRLIDRQVAFFYGIEGSMEDMELANEATVHVSFLEDELAHRNHKDLEMVASFQRELAAILNQINDLVPLEIFSTDHFAEELSKAENERKETVIAIEQFDYELKNEYYLSEADEQYAEALMKQLIEATRQGNKTSPIHFNLEKYKTSELYKRMSQVEQQAADYINFKEKQDEIRRVKEELGAKKLLEKKGGK
ncbi:LXG domain-containing protein [Metabacillus niabensis]|uniref:LXG domain-containing protein n=1 Tax=Metabacillus niabensis TaxID=324854 RepID=UPI002279CD7D|nr:LXG domain-containing protein [Metabacillus niabensis]